MICSLLLNLCSLSEFLSARMKMLFQLVWLICSMVTKVLSQLHFCHSFTFLHDLTSVLGGALILVCNTNICSFFCSLHDMFPSILVKSETMWGFCIIMLLTTFVVPSIWCLNQIVFFVMFVLCNVWPIVSTVCY
jgi:hypothetical protein